MTITNHLLAGSVLALAIHQPVLALPLAYASHFIMDAIPHFGYPGGHNFIEAVRIASKHRLSYYFSIVTAVTFIAVFAILIVNNLWLAIIGGLIAVSPDALMFLNYMLFERKGRMPRGPKLYLYLNLKLHGKIQNERPQYIYIEAFVFMLLSALLLKML